MIQPTNELISNHMTKLTPDALSQITGEKIALIEDMRFKQNMGWGQIKHYFEELAGVEMHPGVLGLGPKWKKAYKWNIPGR